MKVIIAGTRPPKDCRRDPLKLTAWYQTHYRLVQEAIDASGFVINEVVSGKAQGFDTLGEYWARRNNIPIRPFPAEWSNRAGDFNHGAGHDRNIKMAEYADALVAIWDGYSGGTLHMINAMECLDKPHHVLKY